MDQYITHVTGKLTDYRAIEFLQKIADELNGGFQSCNYGPISIPLDELDQVVDEDEERYAITTASVLTDESRINVFYKRGISGNNANGQPSHNVRVPSPNFDEIIVIPNKQTPPSLDEMVLLENIIHDFSELHFSEADVSGSKGAAAAVQKEISGLAKLHRQMISTAEKQRQDYEAEYQQRLRNLEAEKQTHLEEVKKVSEEERAKLEALEKEIEDKQKNLDDRDHMHVRRDLREKITSEIQSNLSKALVPTRSTIMSLFLIAISFLAAIAFGVFAFENLLTLSELLSNAKGETFNSEFNYNLLIWMYSIRAAFLSIASLGFIAYALNWLKKSYLEDVKVSRELQRYALDINRASWTIETIMEMTTKEGRVLPDRWIEGVCYGLFRGGKGEKAEITALDAWGKLLGVSGKAELGPEGPRLQFSKSDTSKVAKSGDSQKID